MDKGVSITIIEDNYLVSIGIKNLVEKEGFIVENIYKTGESFIDDLNKITSDIIIIDIELKGQINGIEIGQLLNQKHPEKYLIFVTGKKDSQTITNILALNPACYIKKPYDDTTLLVNLNLVISKIKATTFEKIISLKDGQKSYQVSLHEILFIKSDRNYVEFYLKDKDMFFIREKISTIESSDDFKDFIKIHRQYLVNPKHIFHYNYKNLTVGNMDLPIAEKYRPDLRKRFK
ncbi:MAG: LytR/AlgR family response regulator transcription factor [Flavobacteriales bacterium]